MFISQETKMFASTSSRRPRSQMRPRDPNPRDQITIGNVDLILKDVGQFWEESNSSGGQNSIQNAKIRRALAKKFPNIDAATKVGINIIKSTVC